MRHKTWIVKHTKLCKKTGPRTKKSLADSYTEADYGENRWIGQKTESQYQLLFGRHLLVGTVGDVRAHRTATEWLVIWEEVRVCSSHHHHNDWWVVFCSEFWNVFLVVVTINVKIVMIFNCMIYYTSSTFSSCVIACFCFYLTVVSPEYWATLSVLPMAALLQCASCCDALGRRSMITDLWSGLYCLSALNLMLSTNQVSACDFSSVNEARKRLNDIRP